MSLLELFCSVDDFWQANVGHWQGLSLPGVGKKRHRAGEDSMVLGRALGLSDRRIRDIIENERRRRG